MIPKMYTLENKATTRPLKSLLWWVVVVESDYSVTFLSEIDRKTERERLDNSKEFIAFHISHVYVSVCFDICCVLALYLKM